MHEHIMNLCVSLFVLFLYLQLASASHPVSCSFNESRTDIQLDSVEKRSFTLKEFDKYVVGKRLSRIYRLSQSDDGRNNFNIEYTKLAEGEYERWETYNGGSSSYCEENIEEHNKVLMHSRNVKSASLLYSNSEEFTLFFSKCPSSYVIMFECDPVDLSEAFDFRSCPVDDAFISIYLIDVNTDSPPDNVPWYSIMKDLYKTTGIKFGSESFKYDYTYGTTKGDCNRIEDDDDDGK